MRIAQVAPIARPVSSRTASSIEQIVLLLSEELVRRGHEVTLFATGDSHTSAVLDAVYPIGYAHDPHLWKNWQFHELVHTAAAFERAADFDVIHSHVYAFPAPLSGLVSTPVVHTDHCPPERDLVRCYARYPELSVVALSEYHRLRLDPLRGVSVIPNAVDVERFPFGPDGGDYLLFLGHLIPRKGPVEAIEVARRAGMPIALAGKGGGNWFDAQVAPLLSGPDVHHLGEVSVAERDRLLAGAAALIFTSHSAEPFGLVLVEAMACGTPVLALDRCAVSEIVEPGVSGGYADDVATLADLAPTVVGLDRACVRAAAARRFDVGRMVDDYQGLYASLRDRETE